MKDWKCFEQFNYSQSSAMLTEIELFAPQKLNVICGSNEFREETKNESCRENFINFSWLTSLVTDYRITLFTACKEMSLKHCKHSSKDILIFFNIHEAGPELRILLKATRARRFSSWNVAVSLQNLHSACSSCHSARFSNISRFNNWIFLSRFRNENLPRSF